MPTYEIYHRLRYLAWYNKTAKTYGEIMDRKSDMKKGRR